MIKFNEQSHNRMIDSYKKGLQPKRSYLKHIEKLKSELNNLKKSDINPNISISDDMVRAFVRNSFASNCAPALVNFMYSFSDIFIHEHNHFRRDNANNDDTNRTVQNFTGGDSNLSYHADSLVGYGGIVSDSYLITPKTDSVDLIPRYYPKKTLLEMTASCEAAVRDFDFCMTQFGGYIKLFYKFKGFTLSSVDERFDSNTLFSVNIPPLLVVIKVNSDFMDDYPELSAMSCRSFETFAILLEQPDRYVRGYYHPHINGSSLCTGDTTVLIRNYLKNGNYWAVGGILHHVLTSYNHRSPYLELNFFDKKPFMIPCHKCSTIIRDYDTMFRCKKCGFVYHRSCLRPGNIQFCDNCLGKEPKVIFDLNGNIIRKKDNKILYTVKTQKKYR